MNFKTKLILVALALFITAAHAFPPAPYHLFLGMVRDEYGNPILSDNAELILETTTGVVIKTKLEKNLEPGTNYRLPVPMDAGITSDLYKSTALRPAVPFKIKVKIGATTYLPMEMVADFSKMGQPGETTHLNLTLGEDLDGDGIPDAWERALLEMLNNGQGLTDLRPEDDADGDGLSNLDEYLSGSFALDEKNGLFLDLIQITNGAPVLEFTAIRGRNYVIEGSSDFHTWTPIDFRLAGSTEVQQIYRATDVRILQVEAVAQPGQTLKFFRLMLR